MNFLVRRLTAVFLTTAGLMAWPATARADFTVSLDTAGLSATPGYSYAIDLQFALGGPSTSNSATVSDVTFGTGGSAGDISTLTTTGAVTGGLSSSIVLSGMSGGFAEFTQGFTPGSPLQFNISLTNFPQPGGMDTFTFGVLYSPGSTFNINDASNIATSNPNGNNAFVEIDTTSNGLGSPTVIASGSNDPNFSSFTSGAEVTATPAPSSLILALIGLSVLLVARHWVAREAKLPIP